MARIVVVFALMVLLAAVVEGRDWRFSSVKRMKRGYNTGFGSDRTYGHAGSDEQNASVSREGLTACSGEGDRGYSGSRELTYNRDGFSNDREKQRGHRSFTKSTASASASAAAFNKNHNLAA